MDKKTYEFLIAGVPYKLKTSHDEALVQDLVEMVNLKMVQSMAVTKNGSYQNAAVLTALHFAEELVLLKKRAHRELEKIEEKTLSLAHDLENSKNQKASRASANDRTSDKGNRLLSKEHPTRSFSDEAIDLEK